MTADLTVFVERALTGGSRGEAEAAIATLSSDVVAHCAASLPFGGDHHGPAAYCKALGELNRLFTLEMADVEVVDTSDCVLLRSTVPTPCPPSGQHLAGQRGNTPVHRPVDVRRRGVPL